MDTPTSNSRVELFKILNNMTLEIKQAQAIIKAASPLANGLKVMASLEKHNRALDRIKYELQELQL